MKEKTGTENAVQKKKSSLLLKLFLTFFKIGAFTFGGGYAMIPLIQRETADKNKWISDTDILEIVAIAESTPGPIAINAATFIGYRVCGFLGAACATLGVVLPSFLIISLIAFVLGKFGDLTPVKYAFFGIRAGVLALILKALVSMFKKSKKDVTGITVMILSFAAVAVFDVNVLYVIICSAILGLIMTAILNGKRAGKSADEGGKEE